MKKVVTFGEIMLRLSPPGLERFLQSPVLSATFGGGEANVAVSLAHFGCESVYVTALPAARDRRGCASCTASRGRRYRSHRAARLARGDLFRGDRSQPAGLDRHLRPGALGDQRALARRIDWSAVLSGAAWFHVTGITPALGPNAAQATARAILAAREAGARVSFDLNYRRKLWTEAEAQRVVGPLLRNVDLVVANEEDLQSVLGIQVANTDVAAGHLAIEGYSTQPSV